MLERGLAGGAHLGTWRRQMVQEEEHRCPAEQLLHQPPHLPGCQSQSAPVIRIKQEKLVCQDVMVASWELPQLINYKKSRLSLILCVDYQGLTTKTVSHILYRHKITIDMVGYC